MVAPDVLPEERIAGSGLVEMNPYASGHRASSTAIEPSIRAELQAVGE